MQIQRILIQLTREAMIDVIPMIVSKLNEMSEFEKVYSPDFFVSESETLPLPSISVVQRWWSESWYHRVLFAIRWKSISETRPLAIKTIDVISNMENTELKWQEVNWWLEDKLEKWYAETFFYMLFYEKDSD